MLDASHSTRDRTVSNRSDVHWLKYRSSPGFSSIKTVLFIDSVSPETCTLSKHAMATGLNNMPRPVGNAVRYVRAGARLLRRTVTKKGRRVEMRFTHETMGVAQQQPQVQIQTRVSRLNHQSRAENNTSNRVTSSPLSLSTNDSTSTTSIGISSSQDSVFDCREYEVDLILSAALIGDKEEYAYDDQAEDAATSAQVNSQSQNNERLNSGSSTSVATSIYKSFKSTKAKIDNFVKWYRRELERRNLI